MSLDSEYSTVLLAKKFTHFVEQCWPQPQIVLHFRLSQVEISMLKPQGLLHLTPAADSTDD